MIAGTTDGQVHLSIYDSFIIGSFDLPKASSPSGTSDHHLVLHASHPTLSTHTLLLYSPSNPQGGFTFLPVDLRFVCSSDGYLPLLASKLTQLQNLLRYIHQIQGLMALEWKSIQDLPQRFLSNVNESLAEKNQGDIVSALYHSVTTGHTFPVVKEWLVDELTERVS